MGNEVQVQKPHPDEQFEPFQLIAQKSLGTREWKCSWEVQHTPSDSEKQPNITMNTSPWNKNQLYNKYLKAESTDTVAHTPFNGRQSVNQKNPNGKRCKCRTEANLHALPSTRLATAAKKWSGDLFPRRLELANKASDYRSSLLCFSEISTWNFVSLDPWDWHFLINVHAAKFQFSASCLHANFPTSPPANSDTNFLGVCTSCQPATCTPKFPQQPPYN